MSQLTVHNAQWSLLSYQLENAVGGSAVSKIDVILCDVTLSNGVTGFGFSYAIGGKGAGAMVAARDISDAVIQGQPFATPEASWRKVTAACNRTGKGPNFVGLAALDVALWDAYAKTLDVPLGQAMGGEMRAVKVYGSGGYRPNHTGDQTETQIQMHREQGFSAIKLRLSGTPADQTLLDRARSVGGDRLQIMVDLNEKTNLVDARYTLDMASDYGVYLVEEPLRARDFQGYRILAERYPGLIATGEHLQGLDEAAPFLQDSMCAAMQPDLAMMGGLTESLRVTRWAEYVGIEIMPHFLPGLFVHLAATAPNLTWLEDFPLLEPLFQLMPTANDGMLAASDTAGHGLLLTEQARKSAKIL